jgi:hypothetical protein
MKNPAILLAFLLFPFAPSAQPSLTSFPSVTIRLKVPDSAHSVFRHFVVLDERPDTARIGLHTFVPTFGAPHNRQLVFRRPAAVEIAAWLNEQFSRPQAPYTALIVLRTLWLSDPNYLREDFVRDPDKVHERTHLRLKAELYASRDSLFLPILRYDTVLAYKNDNPYTSASYYSHWEKDLTDLLADLTDTASHLVPLREGHARLLHLGEIRDFNRSRSTYTIDRAPAFTPGVYASFNEFRNNNPSIRDFEIKHENKERLLYIKEPGGASIYSHDAWGYSDGRSVYVMRDGHLCPVWKEGRAFYFYGGTNKEITMPPGFTNSGQTIEVNVHPIFTIDMDKGIAY